MGSALDPLKSMQLAQQQIKSSTAIGQAYQTGVQSSSSGTTLDWITGITSGLTQLGKLGVDTFAKITELKMTQEQAKTQAKLEADRLKFEQKMAEKSAATQNLLQQQQSQMSALLANMQQGPSTGISKNTLFVGGALLLVGGLVLFLKR